VNHLLRSLAPVSDSGWEMLDQEARERLMPALGARKLVDFAGPFGWQHSATNLGRTTRLQAGVESGVTALQRRVLPLVELRADFSLARDELRDGDRGADDVDLTPLDDAAHQIAAAEGRAIFHGWGDAFTGIVESSPHKTLKASAPGDFPDRVAAAVELLLGVGVGGSYALAAGNELFRLLSGGSEHGGYPLRQHLEKILDGSVIWVPGLTGGVVLSLRGGDFVFESGQDLSIGYDAHDAEHVHLYLQESFSFHVATPEAAVELSDIRP
jgi:uncharacterized linocin/CFP29 family protein